mmetsp:Transcript_61705/g.194557  ORF Transcript_61705/g.194557 Transcript_61705/m.194557 type:complete len:260 (+) Transcript_61705:1302-2081(+)
MPGFGPQALRADGGGLREVRGAPDRRVQGHGRRRAAREQPEARAAPRAASVRGRLPADPTDLRSRTGRPAGLQRMRRAGGRGVPGLLGSPPLDLLRAPPQGGAPQARAGRPGDSGAPHARAGRPGGSPACHPAGPGGQAGPAPPQARVPRRRQGGQARAGELGGQPQRPGRLVRPLRGRLGGTRRRGDVHLREGGCRAGRPDPRGHFVAHARLRVGRRARRVSAGFAGLQAPLPAPAGLRPCPRGEPQGGLRRAGRQHR